MRRMIGLFLALALLLSCVPLVLAADTDGFTDQSAIRHGSAVQMLVDLGLVSGFPDGSFRPNDPIKRAEVAKLLAMIATADPALASGAPFADVGGSWAVPYIGYCASRGILVGSAGLFRPDDNVTTQELAKTMLILLGRDGTRYVGAEWADHVNLDAFQLGLYNGVYTAYTHPIDRDDACRLICNALLCYAVDGVDETGAERFVLDDLMNPMTYLEVRFGLTRYTGVLTGNECADLTESGQALNAGQTRLAGHKLFEVSTGLGLLGRSVDIYMRDGQIIGVPCWSVSETYFTFSHADELKTACESGGFSLSDDTEYYHNFDRADPQLLSHLSSDDYITVIDHDADNVFDIVLVITSRMAVVVSTQPLAVKVDGAQRVVAPFQSDLSFSVGQRVLYSEVLGRGYIRPAVD